MFTAVIESCLRQRLRRNGPRVAPESFKRLPPLILVAKSDGALERLEYQLKLQLIKGSIFAINLQNQLIDGLSHVNETQFHETFV